MNLNKINIKIPHRIYQNFYKCDSEKKYHLFDGYQLSTILNDKTIDIKIENDEGNPWYKVTFCINSIYEKTYYFSSSSELFTIYRFKIKDTQYLINIEKEETENKLAEKKFTINLIKNYSFEPINILNKILCVNFNNNKSFYETCFILINNSEKIEKDALELFKNKSIYQGYDFEKTIIDILFKKSKNEYQSKENLLNLIFLLTNNRLSKLKKGLLKIIGIKKCKTYFEQI